MARTADSWTEAEARRQLAAFEGSNESLAVFCRRIGVSPQRMYYWRDRLRATGAGRPSSLVPQFVEVAVRPTTAAAASTGVIELVFPTGHVVRAPASVGLDQVLRAAGLAGC